MSRKRSAGVSLIELLIAVSLLGMLSAGILMSLDVGLRALEKTNAKVIANRRGFSVQRILRSQIAGFMPVNVDCAPGANRPGTRVPLFEGLPQTMRFVSAYSLAEAARGHPRLVEFQVIAGERGQGVRLVVNETLYTGPAEAGAACIGLFQGPTPGILVPRFRPPAAGAQSFVLADRLAACRFAYRVVPPAAVGPPHWSSDWQMPGWPSAIRVEMVPLEADPSRLSPGTVTAAIRVTRRPGETYAD
jgi:general secretion pathway protein J